jgi:hypothetical protein
MKLNTILATAVLALSTTAQADPILNAQCAAIFKGTAITLADNHPDLARKARHFSDRLKARADAEMGSSIATQYYILKMNDMTASLRANGGTGIHKNELQNCLSVVQSYGIG